MEKVEAKTFIADDIEITGSIKCTSNIQINGKLNGDLSCSGDAVLGAAGNIKGNSSVSSITIMGQINGNVTAKDKIELKSTARVMGDIKAKRMVVEDGVAFVGKAEINPSAAGRSDSKIGDAVSEGNSVAAETQEAKTKGFGKK